MRIRCFSPGRLLGPNATVRHWIGDLERRIHAELGRPTLAQRFKSVLAVGAALWTGLTLKLDLFQHPKLHADDVSPAGQALERVSICGRNSIRKVAIPESLHPSRVATRQAAGLDAAGRRAFRQRTRKAWASASAIRWRGARAGWCWT